jgi:hypothetical protein
LYIEWLAYFKEEMTKHIELEFLGVSDSVLKLNTRGGEVVTKRGGLMVWFWCGGSGLYFGTQPIGFPTYPFFFHCYFTSVQEAGKETGQ